MTWNGNSPRSASVPPTIFPIPRCCSKDRGFSLGWTEAKIETILFKKVLKEKLDNLRKKALTTSTEAKIDFFKVGTIN